MRDDPKSSPDPEDRALRKAAIAALKTGTLPATFRAMVVHREAEIQGYRRVAYQIDRRLVAVQVAPAPGARANEIQAPPNPGAIDPWAVDPAALPSTSAVICTCLTCVGAKKIGCPACGASGRVRCETCGGGGKVSGQRGPKNCPSCRGTGQRNCGACTKGMVKCGPCDGVGKVRAWLEIHPQRFVQVRAAPMNGLAALHDGLLAAEDLDRAPMRYRVPIVHDSMWLDALPERLGDELSPSLAPVTDRVVRQRIQRFESKVYRFRYETRTSQGVIEVSGEPPAIVPGSAWGPLWGRLALAGAVVVVMLAVIVIVHGRYVSRAAWFEGHGNGPAIAMLGLVAAVSSGVAAAALWMPAAARKKVQRLASFWVVVVTWVLIGILWFIGGPTIEAVDRSIEGGDHAAAHAELAALEAVGTPAERLTPVQARLAEAEAAARRQQELAEDEAHLAEVRDAASAVAALEAVARPWKTPDIEPKARDLALQRAHEDLLRLSQAQDAAGLDALALAVVRLDPTLADRARARMYLAKARSLREAGDFSGALAALDGWVADGDEEAARAALRSGITEDLRRAIDVVDLDAGDLDAQRQTLERALVHARLFESLSHAHAKHSASILEGRLERTQKAIEDDRKRTEEAERRKAAAAERARKQAEEAERRRQAAAARASDRVRCCDGTTSPQCRYSQGSLRGCCSHHGGVC